MFDRTIENLYGSGLEIEEMTVDQKIRIAAETAYRRGFDQGACASIEGFAAGYSLGFMREWLRRLGKWRGKQHQGEQELPEWVART